MSTSESSAGVIERLRGEGARAETSLAKPNLVAPNLVEPSLIEPGLTQSSAASPTPCPLPLGGGSQASVSAPEESAHEPATAHPAAPSEEEDSHVASGPSVDDMGAGAADQAALESALESARAQLRVTEEALANARVEREVLEAAFHAGAIDLDAVSALAEKLMKPPATSEAQAMSAADAVRTLRERKPALFRAPATSGAPGAPGAIEAKGAGALGTSESSSGTAAGRWARVTRPGGAMSARSEGDGTARLRDAADIASATGDRSALMNYLRLRRAAG